MLFAQEMVLTPYRSHSHTQYVHIRQWVQAGQPPPGEGRTAPPSARLPLPLPSELLARTNGAGAWGAPPCGAPAALPPWSGPPTHLLVHGCTPACPSPLFPTPSTLHSPPLHVVPHVVREQWFNSSPYEEDVLVPLFIRGPGVPRDVKLPHLLTNTDILPTILELAGAPPGRAPLGLKGPWARQSLGQAAWRALGSDAE